MLTLASSGIGAASENDMTPGNGAIVVRRLWNSAQF